jgi:hypothetical protein
MTLGLFDLPAPLLQWIDDRVGSVFPAPVSIAAWAVLAGIVCLELYRVTSPQKRIGRIKQEAKAAQLALSSYNGEMEGAWPLRKSMLSLSLTRVGIVIPATLLAAYPVVAMLVWMSSAYGHVFPARGQRVAVDVAAPLEGRWLPGGIEEPPQVQARQPDGRVILDLPLAAAVPILHKRQWWNRLMENPAGYLPDDAPVDEVRIDLPRRELHAIGPSWMRGWEAIFLPVLFIAALTYKIVRRID